MKMITKLAGIVALALASSTASAVSTLGSCDLSDVTINGYGSADACYGLVDGNISGSDPNSTNYYGSELAGAFGGAFDGDAWTVAAIDDALLTGSGTWTGNFSDYEELIIVLKQAQLWGAWYFDFADDSGTWTTNWDGDGDGFADTRGSYGEENDWSHAFALVRGTTHVPEPGTLALLGLGLVGAGLARRRKAI